MIDLLNVIFAILLLLLIASGLAVIFGLLGIINFAHGEFLMLGAFAALWMTKHGPFWMALLAAPAFLAACSLIIEAGLIRRLYQRPLAAILATWGLGIVIREAMKLGVGPEFRSIRNPLPGTLQILGTPFPRYRLALMGIVVAVFLILALFVKFTRLGLVTRAVIENPELAAGLGVNVTQTYRVTFALGSALAGIAGALVSPLVTIHPQMGPGFLVNGFLAVIVGGPGSLGGLAGSAAALGTSQRLMARDVSPVAGSITILLLAVVLMRFRPLGLLRRGR